MKHYEGRHLFRKTENGNKMEMEKNGGRNEEENRERNDEKKEKRKKKKKSVVVVQVVGPFHDRSGGREWPVVCREMNGFQSAPLPNRTRLSFVF